MPKQMTDEEAAKTIGRCATCKGTGWVLCDHVGTDRDEDGWCNQCSTPGDLEIDGKVETWCECQTMFDHHA